jgi:mono/diheme cytochrome c family protein
MNAMARRALVGALLVGWVCGFGPGPREARAEDGAKDSGGLLAETGRALFLRHCASCHGASGRGDGPAAPELKKAPADLTHIASRRGGKFPAGDVAAIIDGRFDLRIHGTREMPIWGDRLGEKITESTTPDEVARGKIDALVAYLQTIQQR